MCWPMGVKGVLTFNGSLGERVPCKYRYRGCPKTYEVGTSANKHQNWKCKYRDGVYDKTRGANDELSNDCIDRPTSPAPTAHVPGLLPANAIPQDAQNATAYGDGPGWDVIRAHTAANHSHLSHQLGTSVPQRSYLNQVNATISQNFWTQRNQNIGHIAADPESDRLPALQDRGTRHVPQVPAAVVSSNHHAMPSMPTFDIAHHTDRYSPSTSMYHQAPSRYLPYPRPSRSRAPQPTSFNAPSQAPLETQLRGAPQYPNIYPPAQLRHEFVQPASYKYGGSSGSSPDQQLGMLQNPVRYWPSDQCGFVHGNGQNDMNAFATSSQPRYCDDQRSQLEAWNERQCHQALALSLQSLPIGDEQYQAPDELQFVQGSSSFPIDQQGHPRWSTTYPTMSSTRNDAFEPFIAPDEGMSSEEESQLHRMYPFIDGSSQFQKRYDGSENDDSQ